MVSTLLWVLEHIPNVPRSVHLPSVEDHHILLVKHTLNKHLSNSLTLPLHTRLVPSIIHKLCPTIPCDVEELIHTTLLEQCSGLLIQSQPLLGGVRLLEVGVGFGKPIQFRHNLLLSGGEDRGHFP